MQEEYTKSPGHQWPGVELGTVSVAVGANVIFGLNVESSSEGLEVSYDASSDGIEVRGRYVEIVGGKTVAFGQPSPMSPRYSQYSGSYQSTG